MKWLIPCLLLLAACSVSVEEVDYSSYCGSGDVYRCGEYVRVLGEQNLVYKDGEQILCDSANPSPECQSAIHEACSLMHVCNPLVLCDERSEICTLEYRPVCADLDTGVRCVTQPCPSTEKKTYSNACSACSDEEVIGYREGECNDLFVPAGRLAICTTTEFPVEGVTCVDACPTGYDSFGTQIGLVRCIPHLGEEYFSQLSGCVRSTENCACIKVEQATDGSPLDLGYRCVAHEEYEEFLIHSSGLCKKDLLGVESCMIA